MDRLNEVYAVVTKMLHLSDCLWKALAESRVHGSLKSDVTRWASPFRLQKQIPPDWENQMTDKNRISASKPGGSREMESREFSAICLRKAHIFKRN